MGLLRALIETKFLTIVHIAVFPGDAKCPLDEKLAAQCPLHSERDSSFPPWILVLFWVQFCSTSHIVLAPPFSRVVECFTY